jgi:hypothetical protein
MEEGKRVKGRNRENQIEMRIKTNLHKEIQHTFTQIEILPQRYRKTQRHRETLVQTGKINSDTEGHKLTQLNRETQIHI